MNLKSLFSQKIRIPKNVVELTFAEDVALAPEVLKEFGQCRFPYQVSSKFEKKSDDEKREIILTAIKYRCVKLLWSLECSVGGYAPADVAKVYLQVMPKEKTKYTLYNLAVNSDPEKRAVAAEYTEDVDTLTSLAGDSSDKVRNTVRVNKHATTEIKKRCEPPLGYVKVSQGYDPDPIVEQAVSENKLVKEPFSADWGSAVYRVNHDKSLSVHSTHYDTSG